MAAVEAMGDADTLLVDKTGTITTGQMVIKKIYFNGHYFQLSGHGYEPEGKILSGEKQHLKNLEKLLGFAYLSIKGDVVKEEKDWKPVGDPTEAAIAIVCRKLGLVREKLQDQYKTEMARPFDSQKRYLEAVFSRGKEKWYTFIGAPEFISHELKVDHLLSREYQDLAKKGLRVIGVAVYGPTRSKFFGYALLAIEEEVRENVPSSIAQAQKAGFRVVMMTGDFPETAKAIAAKIGIFKKGDQVLTGTDVERLSEGKLAEKIDKVSVFARITPDHKLKIVNVFKRKGHVVAMTGDGVNDAPALQAANLGISLGSGTQVAKDSSDIVLIDDNFATITASIAEGRGIYLTLKKVILYLFSTSLGEVLVILASLIIGLPLPLVAVQIIWLNFVTDGFFVVVLAQDPPEPGLPSRTQLKSKSLVDSLMVQRSLLMGGSMLVVTLPLFYLFLNSSEINYARTISLLILSITQWLNALNVRASTKSIFQTSIINNWYLIATFGIVVFLQYLAIQTPFGNKLLHTSPLTINHWLLALVVSLLIIIVEEIRKFFVRSRNPTKLLSPNSTVISAC
jgi:Ca2+-transporting ATPase